MSLLEYKNPKLTVPSHQKSTHETQVDVIIRLLLSIDLLQNDHIKCFQSKAKESIDCTLSPKEYA